jgi:cytochrome c556
MKTFVLFATSVLFAGAALAAEPSPENLIKYRQALMHSIGAHMEATGLIARGQVTYQHRKEHADAVASMLKLAADAFPPESKDGDTEALPAIWEKPDAFAAAMKKAQDAAVAYQTAAAGTDAAAMGAALRELGGSCKGCHDDFRKPHEHE